MKGATYFILFLILAAAFFVRVYRIDDLLGFYYDQGRDALVIWKLWHEGKFFLIGPTTGIEGIFRGPFYYYLIAPFYLVGGGNPVWPSIFLSFTTVLSVFLIYHLGKKISGWPAGLLAAIIAAFSFNLVIASRWLSNPTPMLILSMLLVWSMLKVVEGKKWGWPLLVFVAGSSLFHFGSAAEVFYFPAILVFAIWQRKLIDKKTLLVSSVAFAITFLPLLVFDLRHDGILRNNISKFLFVDKSFNLPTWLNVENKIGFYYDVFTNKIFSARHEQAKFLLGTVAFFFVFYLHRMLASPGVKILLLLLASPIIGLIFFQGNFGNIYDYYLTGYYLIFVLLFALVLGFLWRRWWGKIFVIYFMYVFLLVNLGNLKGKLSDQCSADNSICFVNQKAAIDWIFADSAGRPFNVDVYVPPVIPYAYDYLFLWQRRENLVLDRTVPLLYTLYEADPPHPERLEAWLERQKGIGKVESSVKFGGITVERRTRL